MPKPTGPTNLVLRTLIKEMRSRGHKEKNNFLLDLADKLERPTRKRAEVTLSKLNRVCKENDTVVVPGKVLNGILEKPLNVAAFNFSAHAKRNIEKAGGKVLTIKELFHKNPKGSNVRIVV